MCGNTRKCLPKLLLLLFLFFEGESSTMTTSEALELTSRIIRDDEALVEPLMKLLAGIYDARGDPNTQAAIRREVLCSLYSRTDDCKQHLQHFLGDERDDGVIPATSSAS